MAESQKYYNDRELATNVPNYNRQDWTDVDDWAKIFYSSNLTPAAPTAADFTGLG